MCVRVTCGCAPAHGPCCVHVTQGCAPRQRLASGTSLPLLFLRSKAVSLSDPRAHFFGYLSWTVRPRKCLSLTPTAGATGTCHHICSLWVLEMPLRPSHLCSEHLTHRAPSRLYRFCLTLISMCMHIQMPEAHTAHRWKSENNLWDSVLFFPCGF